MNSDEYSQHLAIKAQKEKIKALAADDPAEIRSHKEKATKFKMLAKYISKRFVSGKAYKQPIETTALKMEDNN